MLPPEVAGLHYLVPENPSLFSPNFAMNHQDNIPSLPFMSNYQNALDFAPRSSSLSNSSTTSNYQIAPDFAPQSSSFSNNSTSDEAEDHNYHQQISKIIDERKQRRMVSNRESARRSRMRKQKHLDELWSQVIRLRNENHGLVDKLNRVSESHERVVRENVKLKEEASDLRQMLSDLRIGSPFSGLRDLEEMTCPQVFSPHTTCGENPVKIKSPTTHKIQIKDSIMTCL